MTFEEDDFVHGSIEDLLKQMATEPAAARYTHILIDGPGVTHPAHATVQADPTPDTPSTERAIEVRRAVWSGLNLVLQRFASEATLVYLVWDGKENRAYRRGLHPNYKHGRRPKDPSLHAAMAEVYREARRRGCKQPVVSDYEADDVIASLVRALSGTGARVLIVSEDRDLYQLVADDVHQYHPKGDMLRDPPAIELVRKHTAVGHTHRKSLHGDGGDNVYGLPSVGETTADTLLAEYPTLVLDCLHGVPIWDRVQQLSQKPRNTLLRAGMALVHPVRAPKMDTMEPAPRAAILAVEAVVRETHRLVALEDALAVEI